MSEDIGETEFNDIFLQCPIVKYTRNGAVHSIYHRTTAIPSGFNAYSLFTHTWSDTNNVLGTDFEIYDTYDDLLGGTNKWTYCNYDDSDVGYPRDCGKSVSVGNTWFSMPDGEHSARGLTSGASFELWTGGGCGLATPPPPPSPPPSPLFLTSLVEDANQPKIYASDAAASDGFGISVSLYGNTALIGAYADDDNNLSNSGSVYVFTRSGVSGTFTEQSGKLYASSPGSANLFGNSVSLYGDTALIGAPNHASNGLLSSGTVYVFTRSSTSGLFTQESQLYANDTAVSDAFGCSVSLYGDTALIGACSDNGYDDDNALVQDSGSVYVFALSSTSGNFTQHSQLYAGDAATYDSFGSSVSLHGDTALIGAYGDDGSDNSNPVTDSGSVYVFTRPSADGTFTQKSKLYASDAAASDNFGVSVSLHGNTALVGAWFDDGSDESKSGSGSVYVFTRSTTDGTFTEQFKLYASDAAEDDFFGASVSLYGDTILVGARDDDGPDTNSPSNSGSVYVFRKPQELYEDEDGWSLLLAYNHVGGEKEDLVPGVAPQSPTGYSHIWLDDIGLTADDVEAVRFYCTSALHSRVAHWSTDALIAKQSIINGILGPFTGYTSWSTGTTKFSDHTADIPDAINDG